MRFVQAMAGRCLKTPVRANQKLHGTPDADFIPPGDKPVEVHSSGP